VNEVFRLTCLTKVNGDHSIPVQHRRNWIKGTDGIRLVLYDVDIEKWMLTLLAITRGK